MIAALAAFGALLVAVHLMYPAPREATRDVGTSAVWLMFGTWEAAHRWRERSIDMPTAVAWLIGIGVLVGRLFGIS